MASTAHKTEEEKKEFFDSKEVLDEKITLLAKWIKESKHFIAFTGGKSQLTFLAGISTSAGIPDYRSGVGTVLPTGPGAWEKAATGAKDPKKYVRQAIISAVPTFTHMSFVKLMEEGYLKFLISQNVDGLHRKSGIPASKLAEVHGNTNLEKCLKCKREIMRDFRVRNAAKVHDHKTGRKCPAPGCGGDLVDSIINFGENLPERELTEGFAHGSKADVCLAMGSSLRVTPAADMPAATAEKGRLVIVNLQKTPLDKSASLCIHGMCDDVMTILMKKLELVPETFKLKRRVEFDLADKQFLVKGVDAEGNPYSLFSKVQIESPSPQAKEKEPFSFTLSSIPAEIKVTLYFRGHYAEPPATLAIPTKDLKKRLYSMEYNPMTKEVKRWEKIIPL